MKHLYFFLIMSLFPCWLYAGDYNVLNYGAQNDGKTLTTRAIQQAIDACFQQGGGTVRVPKGEYLVGTLNLKSNVNFHLEVGAKLIATTDLSCYQINNEHPAGVFYTENADHVSITGKGIIYGQGMEFMEKDVPKRITGDVCKYIRQGSDFRKVPDGGIGDGPLNPKERFHQMVIFSNCTNVRLEDFTCIDAPYWTILIVHCDGVEINKLVIDNNLLIPNSDGCDIISSSNVSVSDCRFSCGDDALVLAGYAHHYGDPGFKDILRPSRNINVSNCVFRSRSSGIRIGGWDQNQMSDYNFNNITIYDSNRGINIGVGDSASVQRVNFTNIHIQTRLHTGDWWGNGDPINISAIEGVVGNPVGQVRDIFFTNITCEAENAILLYASDATKIENVYFTNFDFLLKEGSLEDVSGGNFDLRPTIVPEKEIYKSDIPIVHLENVSHVYFNQGRMRWGKATRDYHTHAIKAIDVDGLVLQATHLNASPSHPELAPVALDNCRHVVDESRQGE